jgi:hypothetical protein
MEIMQGSHQFTNLFYRLEIMEIMEKSGKLIYGHGIMEKVMELPTPSGNSVQVVVKAKRC